MVEGWLMKEGGWWKFSQLRKMPAQKTKRAASPVVEPESKKAKPTPTTATNEVDEQYPVSKSKYSVEQFCTLLTEKKIDYVPNGKKVIYAVVKDSNARYVKFNLRNVTGFLSFFAKSENGADSWKISPSIDQTHFDCFGSQLTPGFIDWLSEHYASVYNDAKEKAMVAKYDKMDVGTRKAKFDIEDKFIPWKEGKPNKKQEGKFWDPTLTVKFTNEPYFKEVMYPDVEIYDSMSPTGEKLAGLGRLIYKVPADGDAEGIDKFVATFPTAESVSKILWGRKYDIQIMWLGFMKGYGPAFRAQVIRLTERTGGGGGGEGAGAPRGPRENPFDDDEPAVAAPPKTLPPSDDEEEEEEDDEEEAAA